MVLRVIATVQYSSYRSSRVLSSTVQVTSCTVLQCTIVYCRPVVWWCGGVVVWQCGSVHYIQVDLKKKGRYLLTRRVHHSKIATVLIYHVVLLNMHEPKNVSNNGWHRNILHYARGVDRVESDGLALRFLVSPLASSFATLHPPPLPFGARDFT